jgi:hypothetical protein
MPSLRSVRFVQAFERTLSDGSERGEFRVLHYSLQSDHAHFVVEAAHRFALARGMKSLGARLALVANRAFARRGPVLDGRYRHRVLRTPREVRNALAYVLLNARGHLARRGARLPGSARIDPASSGRWFDGWTRGVEWAGPREEGEACVARPRSWLARAGWRRHGRISPGDLPADG